MKQYNSNVMGYFLTPLLILLILSSQLFSESDEESYSKIIERKRIILSASERFGINPMHLSSIIYTERTKNFDWTDEAFDEMIARVGQNSSIGFCQVKIKTAYFIELQLTDSKSEFYCGKKYEKILQRSEEHTSELQSHSFISYAVFCLKKKKKQK